MARLLAALAAMTGHDLSRIGGGECNFPAQAGARNFFHRHLRYQAFTATAGLTFCFSRSATRNASSSAWSAFNRGSQWV